MYAHIHTKTHTDSTHTHGYISATQHTGYQLFISNDGAHALLITTSHKFYLWEESSGREETLTSDSQWWLFNPSSDSHLFSLSQREAIDVCFNHHSVIQRMAKVSTQSWPMLLAWPQFLRSTFDRLSLQIADSGVHVPFVWCLSWCSILNSHCPNVQK